ncbi:hypothetical protein [Lysobacter gummosus]|uniref:hypothetical protein n=1 Tax=Lysobacter gummosus TaxID=262324 RepID=UPI00362F4B52
MARARASRRRLGIRVIITSVGGWSASARGAGWRGSRRQVSGGWFEAGQVELKRSIERQAGISAPGCSKCRCRTPGP